MANSFPDTLVEYNEIQREFLRRASRSADAMHKTSLRTREAISQSRDVLAKADRILARHRRLFNCSSNAP
jgi:hypothetical protein